MRKLIIAAAISVISFSAPAVDFNCYELVDGKTVDNGEVSAVHYGDDITSIKVDGMYYTEFQMIRHKKEMLLNIAYSTTDAKDYAFLQFGFKDEKSEKPDTILLIKKSITPERQKTFYCTGY